MGAAIFVYIFKARMSDHGGVNMLVFERGRQKLLSELYKPVLVRKMIRFILKTTDMLVTTSLLLSSSSSSAFISDRSP